MGKKMQIKAEIMITVISNPERLLIFLDKGEYKTDGPM